MDGEIVFSFDMDSTIIRNERLFRITKSTGVFANEPRQQRFYEHILYSVSRKMYEFIAYEYGAASPARPWLVDTKAESARYSFASYDVDSKQTLETIVTLKAVNDHELVETFETIAFETGKTVYKNVLRMRKN